MYDPFSHANHVSKERQMKNIVWFSVDLNQFSFFLFLPSSLNILWSEPAQKLKNCDKIGKRTQIVYMQHTILFIFLRQNESHNKIYNKNSLLHSPIPPPHHHDPTPIRTGTTEWNFRHILFIFTVSFSVSHSFHVGIYLYLSICMSERIAVHASDERAIDTKIPKLSVFAPPNRYQSIFHDFGMTFVTRSLCGKRFRI